MACGDICRDRISLKRDKKSFIHTAAVIPTIAQHGKRMLVWVIDMKPPSCEGSAGRAKNISRASEGMNGDVAHY